MKLIFRNIWISRLKGVDEQGTGGYVDDTELVPFVTREIIARTANCIKLWVFFNF